MCKNNCNGCKCKLVEMATTYSNHDALNIACAGGFLGGTPKKINVQIPEDLFNKVEAHAEESGLLTDDVIANALYCHFVELEAAK